MGRVHGECKMKSWAVHILILFSCSYALAGPYGTESKDGYQGYHVMEYKPHEPERLSGSFPFWGYLHFITSLFGYEKNDNCNPCETEPPCEEESTTTKKTSQEPSTTETTPIITTPSDTTPIVTITSIITTPEPTTSISTTEDITTTPEPSTTPDTTLAP